MIPQGWTIGRLGGIEIKVNPGLLFIAFFVALSLASGVFPQVAPGASPVVYWLAGLVASSAFVGSVLWHEMAHSLMAIRFGIPVVQIVLHLFGGVAQIARDPERPGQEFWIAIVGPLSSAFLAVFFGLLTRLGGVAGAACSWLSAINLTLALFNLLPGFPLDGGRVLRSFLWRIGGSYRRATRQASRVGQGMAGVFVLLALLMIADGLLFNGLWFVLIAAFLYSAASLSYRMAAQGAELPPHTPIRRVTRFNVPIVEPGWPLALLAWRYLDHYPDQAFPVMAGGELVGMVTVTEVNKYPRLEWGRIKVEQVMLSREKLIVLHPEDVLQSALERLEVAKLDHAPVFAANQLVGMLNRRDIVYRT